MTTTSAPRAVPLLLLLGALCAPPAVAWDAALIQPGPLRVRDQFLLGMGFLAFDPAVAEVLPEGEWQADLIVTATNHFARSDGVAELIEGRSQRAEVTLEELRAAQPANGERGTFFVDGEVYRAKVAVRRGVGRGIQVEATLPVVSFQGGIVDSLAERFHTAFSFDQEGRLGVLRDTFTVYARNQDRELFLPEAPDLTLGDAVVGARFRLRPAAPAPSLRMAVEALLKLPTGDTEPIASSGSVDFGVNFVMTRYSRRHYVHGSLGLLSLGRSKRLGLSSQFLLSGMLGYEGALNPATSWLIQMTVAQTPFRELGLSALEEPSIQATVGVKRALGKSVVELGVTENFGSFNNAPDVGFHVGWTRNFGRPAPAD
ncbi:MAG: DUF3187 family protein [Thermoanaerobaculia bacterium]|nr:DUF3187 family protein [Thermoanaerobaculia bacterium]